MSVRRLEGFGMFDGECVERLWAYLRPFYKTTKEMTTNHRIHLLDEALLHFIKRKNYGLGIETVQLLLYKNVYSHC